jgi:hypothetical protein
VSPSTCFWASRSALVRPKSAPTSRSATKRIAVGLGAVVFDVEDTEAQSRSNVEALHRLRAGAPPAIGRELGVGADEVIGGKGRTGEREHRPTREAGGMAEARGECGGRIRKVHGGGV